MRLSGIALSLLTLLALLSAPPAVAHGPAPDASAVGPVRAEPFSMVGVTWRGGGTPAAEVRTRDADGWSRWQSLEPLTDGPSESAAEATGVRGSELLWVGPSSAAQLRTTGAVPAGLDLVLIDPGTRARDAAPAPRRAARTTARAAARPTRAPRPRIYSRRDWGADESLRNGTVRYTDRLRQVHVHHTATGNGYSRSDVPALIRGMYEYHTQRLGWFDLGYNFLVDRFGRVWEGRSGGPSRLVQGAHTLGFNEHSVGIAVIGSHDGNRASDRSILMVARVAAWKLDKARRKATGTVAVRSTGSDKYAAGRRVRLPVIDGHRDTNDTACPGERIYRRLGEVRRLAQRRMNRFD
ncbi:N-acetylmuramoyl-L-alanine amidase [Nocardioides lianchengensis]|uniref:N-acetylmuramoyl-L-alanine amidase n=1 Tax=Nocardioides lianchengensis TaxID=1045774 RepID=A0A1G6UJH0_9ACTN|nr:N-acetylmuramoyl-L-alanine amidase [Nocardioides lianchengensis]NYG10956.1 uncharacterized protein with LGFP repeats [Nocardioides lianchengensis]SDD41570.1 N-acetylmuramoyl-L-alanine amidase [Nocardioides lianchengensis]